MPFSQPITRSILADVDEIDGGTPTTAFEDIDGGSPGVVLFDATYDGGVP